MWASPVSGMKIQKKQKQTKNESPKDTVEIGISWEFKDKKPHIVHR